jgi:predicted DNA-binding transcriptional regulator AlpA
VEMILQEEKFEKMPDLMGRNGVIPRRGLSRVEAAAYVGISPSKFDELVADGRMPGARRIDARRLWDVRELDLYWDDLPREDSIMASGKSWEDV